MSMTRHGANYSLCPGPRLVYQQSHILLGKPYAAASHLEFCCKTKLTTPVLYLSVLSYLSRCYTMRKFAISQFKMDCCTILTDHKKISEYFVYNNEQEFCFHPMFSMMSTKHLMLVRMLEC